MRGTFVRAGIKYSKSNAPDRYDEDISGHHIGEIMIRRTCSMQGRDKKHMKKNSWRKCVEDFTWKAEDFNVHVIKYTYKQAR
jgi:hypothetical protein